ncbi:beta strand repeat-containing protein [Reichenbachiella sp.]|uniref:beta strand repeat-containing protein n=1 Tax=Reichenbachiella sp. TaxID=2184521 RepID=UPI003B597FC9
MVAVEGHSAFIQANGGGAITSSALNDMQIEVKATTLTRNSGTLDNGATIERDPGFSLDVSALDANGNVDLDVAGAVEMTFPAGEALSGIPSDFTAGTLNITNGIIDNVFVSGTVSLNNIPNDADLDGVPDLIDHDIVGGLDDDGDDIPNRYDFDEIGGLDTDVDGIVDFYDPDITPLDITTVTIQDTTDPVVNDPTVDLSPGHTEAAAVAVTELQITFSENVRAVGGNLIMRDFNTLDVVETISVTNLSRTTVAGNVVTFSLSTILDKGTTYFVTVPAGSFEDYGTNSWAGLIGAGAWSFTTADATNPSMAFSAPADGVTDISRSSNITLTFDEPVESNGGTITLVGDISYNQSYVVGVDGEITGMGSNEITINPSVNFTSGEVITVSIPDGSFIAVDDSAPSVESGADGVPDATETIEFTAIVTLDNTAPLIASQVYTDFNSISGTTVGGDATLSGDGWTSSGDVSGGATAVNSVGSIGNAAELPATPGSYIQSPAVTNASSMTFVYSAGAGAIINVVDPSGPTTLTTLNVAMATSGFEEFYYEFVGPYSGNIQLEVDAGSGANIIIDEFSIDRGVLPYDGNGDVALETGSLTIAFDEDIQAGTGVIRLFAKTDPDIAVLQYGSNSGLLTYNSNELTIDISSLGNLPGGVTFYVGISEGAIEDLAGNPFAGIDNKYTWNFTTVPEVIPPEISVLTPEDNGTGISTSDPFILKFNEPVVASSSGTVTLYVSSSGDALEQFDVTSDILNTDAPGSLSLEGNELRIYPSNELSGLTGYNVRISNNAFEDYSGNAFAGIPTANGWNFTTGNFDATSPVIDPGLADFEPLDGSTTMSLSPDISFTMSEPVNGVSGQFFQIHNITDNTDQFIDTQDFTVAYVGNKVEINNVMLEYNKDYYILIPAGSIEDNSGNATTVDIGSTGNGSDWTFTTLTDVEAPFVTELLADVDDVIATQVSRTFVMKFNEDVQWNTGNVNLYYKDADGMAVASLDVTSDVNPVNEVPEDFNVGGPVYATGTWTFNNAVSTGTAVSIGAADGDYLVSPYIEDLTNISFDYSSALGGTDAGFEVYYSVDGTSLTTLIGAPVLYNSATPANFNMSTGGSSVDGYIIIRSDGLGTANVLVDDFVYTSTSQLSFEFDLPSGGTDYYITVDPTAITDVTTTVDNAFAGYSSTPEANRWKFETSNDGKAPVLTAYLPADDAATPVTPIDATTAQIVLTFDELVTAQAEPINAYYLADDKLAFSIMANAVTPAVIAGETTFTYDIELITGNQLSGSTEYYFVLEGDEFLDNDSGPTYANVAFGSSADWNIITNNDGTAPAIDSFTPGDDQFSINASTSSIVIDFKERVVPGAGSLRLFLASNDYEIATLPASSAILDDDVAGDLSIAQSGSQATFAVELSGSTNYYVTLDADAFQDVAGNSSIAIGNDGTWNFRTAGESDDPIAAFLPNDNVVRAIPYTGLQGRFGVGETVSGSGETADIVFNDEVNDILYVENESAGTVGDIAAISSPSASATSGTLNVPEITILDDLILKFNEPVFTQSGTFITISDGVYPNIVISTVDISQVSGNGTDIITIDPTNPLQSSTTYSVTVDAGAFSDISGVNLNAEINTWTFTTNDGIAIDDNSTMAFAAPYDVPVMTSCTFGDYIDQQQDIMIGELVTDAFADANGTYTLELSISAGFEFEPGQGDVVLSTAGDLTLDGTQSNRINVTASTITITYDNDGNGVATDVLSITGLRIKTTGGSTGTITRSGGDATIYGFDVSHGISVTDIGVESVGSPTVNAGYTNSAFCQDLDPDDPDGMAMNGDEFNMVVNTTLPNTRWYRELGTTGAADYVSGSVIDDTTTPTFAQLFLGGENGVADTYNVYVSEVNANGCESPALERTVVIHALPDAEAAAGDDLTGICSYEEIEIGDADNDLLAAGYTFAWTGDNMGTQTGEANPVFDAPQNTDAGDPYSNTDVHTYSLVLTEDATGCVSDPGITAEMTVTIDPRVEVLVSSTNGLTFSETLNDPQEILGDRTVLDDANDNNLSGYTGFFIGIPGLANIATSSDDQHSAEFTPFAATAGLHTIEYVLTDNSTLCADTASITISVATNVTAPFAGSPESDICGADASFDLTVNGTNLDGNTFVRFIHSSSTDDGSNVTGGVITGAFGDLTADAWTFDPVTAFGLADNGVDVIDVNDTKLIRVDRVVNDGMTDFVDGSFTFTVHPQPTIDITTVGVADVSDNFCSSNIDVTIAGTVTNDAGSPALTISAYEIRQVTPVATTFESIAATHIDFDELLTHTGIYAGISATTAGEGLYEIRVTSDAGDDAYGNPPGCTNTATAQFNLFAKPNTPTIALVGGTDPLAQVSFEFCEDAIPLDFNLDLQGGTIAATERFEWDDDNMFGSPISLAGIGSTAELADVGINATPGGNDFETTTLYVRRIGFENSPFTGCISDALTVTATVYQTQETPELVTYTSIQDAMPSAQAQSDGSILLEFCVGDPLTVLQADVSSFSADNAMPAHANFNWYYDNTGDGIPETYINSTDEFLSVAEMDAVLANIADVSENALTPGSYTFGFTQTDFDTGAGSGSFIHNGCESDMRTIDIEIKTTPSDIVIADGFTTEYFTCEGSPLANITTVNEGGVIYTWYGDDGDGVDEIGAADGMAIKEGISIDDSELNGSMINGYDNATPGTSYFWVTRKTDRNAATTFDGCESSPVLLAATVNENYTDVADQVNFEGNGPGVGKVGSPIVLNFCNDELSATDVFNATSTYTDGTFSSLAIAMHPTYTAKKKFTWYTSNASGDALAPLSNSTTGDSDDGATGEGSVITAQELFLVGKPSDDTNYFLVTQTTDILNDGSIDAGCESISDGILIQVNTYDIPSAPTELATDGSLSDFYYCENDAVAAVQVEGEASVTFYWYQTEADALAGTNRLTTTDPTGATIQSSELQPDEMDFHGMAVANLGGTPTAGDYSFWFTQASDIVPMGFVGCESLPTEVTIHILETPTAPAISPISPTCDDVAAPVLTITNTNPGDIMRWYDASGEDPLDPATDVPIHESDFADPSFNTDGFATGMNAPTTGDNWMKTFYLYRVENNNIDGLGFAGCANTAEIPAVITIYPKPASPTTDGVGATGRDIFAYCEGEDVSMESWNITGATQNTGDVAKFRWYSSDPDLASLTPFLESANTTSGGGYTASFDFTQIENNSDVDINSPVSTTIYVTQLTNDLCESDSYQVDVEVNALPTVDIVDFGTVNTFTTAYCNDNGVVTLQGKGEGVDYSGANGVWSVNTGGLTDNGTGDFDPNAAATAAGQGPFGTSTDHQITYAYTKDYTGDAPISCTSEITKSITVHGIPDLDILNNSLVDPNGNNLTDDGAIEICENEGSFTITGIENQAKGGTATYTITGGINDGQIGTGGSTTIFPSELGNEIELANNTLLEHDFGIRFDFVTTTGGCAGSISKTVTVNVLPEVEFEVDGGCIDPDVNFHAELRFPGTSPYALSNDAVATGNNLVLNWNYYYANAAGLPNLSDPYGSTTDIGINVDETFDLQGEETGTFAAILTATTELGCQSVVDELYTQKAVNILIDPSISFKWNGVTAGEETEFIYRETLLNLAQVSRYAVSYDGGVDGTFEPLTPVVQGGLEVDGVDVYDPFYHTFTNPGKYDVALVLESTNTCYDTLLHNVNIIPLIDVGSLPESRFVETFDVGSFDPDVDGWYVERLKDDALSIVEFEEEGTLTVREHSWNYGALDLEALGMTDGESPGDLASALTGAWSTTLDNNHYLSNEDSWLYTPAFDISGLNRPMVQFNMIYDFAVNQDGGCHAVFC